MEKNIFKNYQQQRWTFVDYQQEDIDRVKDYFNISELLAKVLIHNTDFTDCRY